MLQLGLLRVITWPGSRFKKQGIKAQNLFVPTRSSILTSVNHALDLVWVFALIFRWWFGYWQVYFEQAFNSFLLRVCRTSFFLISLSLFFAWTVSFLITDGYVPAAADATEEQRTVERMMRKRDQKAMFYIHQCVDESVFEKIADSTTSKGAWDLLVRCSVVTHQ